MSLNIIIALILSFSISCFCTYTLIRLSLRLGVGDAPSETRKLHQKTVPNIGGIAVFIATMFTYFIFSDYTNMVRPDKIFSIAILLFFIGLWDDIEPVPARARLLTEFACALLIIYISDLRFITLWGIFGITELPIWSSYILTSLFIVGCVNAYNLIDGLDGLLSILSLLGAFCFGFIFKFSGEWLWTLLCVAIYGALIGFWLFNRYPAKILMGDGGALFLGTLFACFSLRIMQLQPMQTEYLSIKMLHTIAYSIIAIPVTDMVIVFFIRCLHRVPPFLADNRHLHHRIHQAGCSHTQTGLIMCLMNVLVIFFAYKMQNHGALVSLVFTILFCVILEIIVINGSLLIIRKNNKNLIA